jgi:hypothetical protein
MIFCNIDNLTDIYKANENMGVKKTAIFSFNPLLERIKYYLCNRKKIRRGSSAG